MACWLQFLPVVRPAAVVVEARNHATCTLHSGAEVLVWAFHDLRIGKYWAAVTTAALPAGSAKQLVYGHIIDISLSPLYGP